MVSVDRGMHESVRRWLLVVLTAAIAMALARPYAGGWNDGTRLASVEALVDHGQLAIDDSVFLRVPAVEDPRYPYDPDAAALTNGTLDKLWIDGRFYSDKPMLPSVFMAGAYAAIQQITGLRADAHPRAFAYAMTLLSTGLAYVVAVLAIDQLAQELGVRGARRNLLTASFALATVAPCYAWHVNGHLLLLGVAAPLIVFLLRAEAIVRARMEVGGLVALMTGAAVGAGYAIDQGVGPMLALTTSALVGWRWRAAGPIAIYCLAAAPFAITHHALNYAIGGTFGPANAVAAYLAYPGAPFSAASMTGGGFAHAHAGAFALYAASMFFGKKGFLFHNLPLLLMIVASWELPRRRPKEGPLLLWAAAWSAGSWLLYAAMSSNSSGACVSVRWFVPLLAPGYLAMAILLREAPRYAIDLMILSVGGGVMSALMVVGGPWRQRMVPGYWAIIAATLLAWWGLVAWRQRAAVNESCREVDSPPSRRAA